MKKMQTAIVICVLSLGLALSGNAKASFMEVPQDGKMGPGFHHRGEGMDFLERYMHENLMVQVLSEVTGQPPETIRQKIEERNIPAVFDEYKIDQDVFRKAMRAKTTSMIKKLTEDGFITAEQQKEIFERMEAHEQRRELMDRLIQKGIKDGTITQEQAQMLMPKPR